VPIDRAARLRQAGTLMRDGRVDEAIAAYRQVLDEQPDDWSTANLLGDAYAQAGRADLAIEQFTRAANRLADEGFLSRASALYRKILKLSPESDRAWVRAAELSAGQERLADARASYAAAARVRRARGDEAGAAAAENAARALDLQENHVPGVALRPLRQPAGDPTDAIPAAAPAETEDPGPLHATPGSTTPAGSSTADDIEAVFARLRDRASSTAGEEADVAYGRGVGFYQSGDFAAALDQLRLAARVDHRRFQAARLMATIHQQQKRVSQAIEWLGHAVDAPFVPAIERHEALLELAALLEASGEASRALAVCLELRADAGDWRDVAERIARLSRLTAGEG
jgi:tetratricopeptide (TPR) repeat protein